LDTGWSQLATDAAVASDLTTNYTPKLAYDPTTGHWIMNYIRGANADGVVNLYSSVSNLSSVSSIVNGSGRRQSVAAYQPLTRGWLVGWHSVSNNLIFYPLKADLSNLITGPSFIPS